MYHVPVLGGDTNFDDAISVNTTGIGTIRQTKPLLRKTVRPGDRLYTTGTMGAGNAFAYARFFDSTIVTTYQPVARLKESNIIRQYATACIDTSDGFFPALSILSAVNAIGFRVAPPLQALLSTEATKTYMKTGIPCWTLLAGPHGEYELLFAVSPATEAAFNAAGASAGWQPLYVGECIAEQHLFFTSEAVQVVCEPSEIANLFHDAGGDVHHYFELLLRKHAQWQTIKSYSYAKD